MYSGSRGILYTAPPGHDESDDDADADAASMTADASTAQSAESDDGLAADD